MDAQPQRLVRPLHAFPPVLSGRPAPRASKPDPAFPRIDVHQIEPLRERRPDCSGLAFQNPCEDEAPLGAGVMSEHRREQHERVGENIGHHHVEAFMLQVAWAANVDRGRVVAGV